MYTHALICIISRTPMIIQVRGQLHFSVIQRERMSKPGQEQWSHSINYYQIPVIVMPSVIGQVLVSTKPGSRNNCCCPEGPALMLLRPLSGSFRVGEAWL